MAIVRAADTVVHALHGSTFTSYIAPSRGSTQLCGWQLDVPPNTSGADHVVSHEEILLVLSGELSATVDGHTEKASSGEAVLVPAGGRFRLDTSAAGARAWVVTSAGLSAVLPDGTRIAPPWAR